MELLDEVKTALRIRSTAFDETELMPLIKACMADLGLAGVEKIEASDMLVRRAVVLYVKANFGFAEDSEKYARAYAALRNSMALSCEYGGSGNALL